MHYTDRQQILPASPLNPSLFSYSSINIKKIHIFNQAPTPATTATIPAPTILIGAPAPVKATTLFVELGVNPTTLSDEVCSRTTVDGGLLELGCSGAGTAVGAGAGAGIGVG